VANDETDVTCHSSPITLDVLNGLTALVNKSLVVQYPGEDESRFSMLETIREYALERLAALRNGEAEIIRRRHSIYYLKLAEAARSQLTSTQQVMWLDRLENEHGNLRAALGWALESRNVTIAAQLGGALSHFWAMHGHLSEGRRWLERALATDTDPFHLALPMRVVLLNGAGSLAYYQGDHAAARLYFEEGLALARQVGDQWNIAFALDGLGAQFANQGDFEQAQAFSEQSLALSRSIGDKWLSGITLINLGELARVQGNYGRAILCYESSLTLLREGGDKLFMAIVLHDLGQMAQDRGQYDQAKTIHMESLVLCRALGSKRGIAMCLEKLAGIAVARCQPERAARLLGTTEALRQAITAPMGAADHADYGRFVALTHAGLDDNTFAAAWAEGRAMTLEQAVAYALEEET
jgi:tetratricopeptide (TPR) repeat protein